MPTAPVTDIDTKEFQGGNITVRSIGALNAGQFSRVQNMRPLRPTFEKRGGQRKLNLTSTASTEVKTIFQYEKSRVTDYDVFAQLGDDLYVLTEDPPTITSSTPGSVAHAGTSGTLPASYGLMKDYLLYANGSDYHQIYGGNNSPVTGFIVYKGTSFPRVPDGGWDYSVQVSDSKSTTYAEVDSLSTRGDFDCVFIRTPVQVDAFNITVSNANSNASVMQGHYWNGAWTALTGFSDGTSVSGVSLAQTGQIVFNEPTDLISKYQFGTCGYWYQLSLSSGSTDSDVTITSVTFNSEFNDIENIWDGGPVNAIEAIIYDASEGSYSNAGGALSVDVASMTSSDVLYVSTYDPVEGFYIDVSTTPNTASGTTTLSLSYWNGSAWTALSGVEDGTSGFTKTGWIAFDRQTDVQKLQFEETQYYAHWYKLTVSQEISATSTIGVETMPVYDVAGLGLSQCVETWKQRAVYTCKDGAYLYTSAQENPLVLNGIDYGIVEVGDGRHNKVKAMRKFHNELLVWQEEIGEKGGCLTLIEGYSPTTFGALLLSDRLGTMNSKSVAVVEGVLVSTGTGDRPKTVSYFLSREGIFATDGATIFSISDDVQNYFMPTRDECIRRGYEDKMWLSYDSAHNVLLVGLVSGEDATEVNVELVYDLIDKCWYFDDRAQKMACVTEVSAKSGDIPVLQLGGGINDGTVYQINYGDNDYGTPIDSYVHMEVGGKGEMLEVVEIALMTASETGGTAYVELWDSGRKRSTKYFRLIPHNWGQKIVTNKKGVSLNTRHLGLRIGNKEPQQDVTMVGVGVRLNVKKRW